MKLLTTAQIQEMTLVELIEAKILYALLSRGFVDTANQQDADDIRLEVEDAIKDKEDQLLADVIASGAPHLFGLSDKEADLEAEAEAEADPVERPLLFQYFDWLRKECIGKSYDYKLGQLVTTLEMTKDYLSDALGVDLCIYAWIYRSADPDRQWIAAASRAPQFERHDYGDNYHYQYTGKIIDLTITGHKPDEEPQF